METTTSAPASRRKLIEASLLLAAGILASSAMATVAAGWAVAMAALVMAGTLLAAGLWMRSVVPVPWAPVAGAALMAATVLGVALLLSPHATQWSTSAVTGGAFIVMLITATRDRSGWETVIGTAILAAALVFAVLT